jgi:Zn-dependent protease
VLKFRLIGIPVAVRPSFLVVAALIGFSAISAVEAMLAWIGIVFFSILIHELGHALTARSFGSDVAIELNAIGGLTTWTVPPEEFGPGRRALVAAAGSAVGVLFGALVWVFYQASGPFDGLTQFVVLRLIYVNLFWGLLNWLPVRPLDGGHLLNALLEKLAPTNAERIANVVFRVFAAAAFAFSLWSRNIFLFAITAWLLWIELAMFQRAMRPPPPVKEHTDEPVTEIQPDAGPEEAN